MKFVIAAALAVVIAPAGLAHASNRDPFVHSRHSGISHHGPPRASGGHNASTFCDARTAIGTMNCAAYQFAHRSLPLRSHHTLCSHAGCVLAMVVDRGPAAWTGRSFDLSPALARALRIDGLGSVWIR